MINVGDSQKTCIYLDQIEESMPFEKKKFLIANYVITYSHVCIHDLLAIPQIVNEKIMNIFD